MMEQSSGEAQFANLKPQELERLDTLVSEYLLFRSFKQTQQQLFLDKRSPATKLNGDDAAARNQRSIIQRILNALDSGDYPRILTLWDTYISQKIGTVKSTLLNAEARDSEFLVNLNCAVYPFRSSVIQQAGTPEVAAKVAARSMAMFKHYVETRGVRLVQRGEDFAAYKHLFKAQFPPSHPQFQHLFSEQWYSDSRQKIITFLEKFFAPEDEPVLCQLYQKLNSRSESELKAVFRRRERKLLRFARSILTLSNDLLSALEGGKKVEKSFLASFRSKFTSFQEVLSPDMAFDDDMRDPAAALFKQEARHGSPHNSPGAAQRFSPGKRNSPDRDNQYEEEGEGERAELSLSLLASKVKQRYDAKVLEYDAMSKDLVFVLHQVGDEVEGLLTRGNALSGADAAVICQAAMQGAVLLQGLVQSVLRQDKEFHPEAERNSAVLALSHADIFGLRKALKGDFISEIGSDGISLESRSITRFLSLLATSLRRIPAFKPDPNAPNPHLPPHERLLTAAEIVAEYLCRLVTAMGMSRNGLAYLHTSGVHLTIAMTSFLVALPLPDFNPKTSIYAVGESSSRVPVRARSGNAISSWCLMALTTLVGGCKPHQLAVVKNGGLAWLSKALGHFVRDFQDKIRSEDPDAADPPNIQAMQVSDSTSSASLFELCLFLLLTVLESLDAQRMLVSSLSMQREAESLLGALLLLCVKPGIAEDHVQVIRSVVNVLLREVTTREACREMRELALLKSTLADGAMLSITEAAGNELLQLIASDSYNNDSSDTAMSTEEIMKTVWAAQIILPESSILSRYIGGAVSGVSFLMRYSKRGSAPLPLFNDRWEPESQPSNSPQRDRAKFNDEIPVKHGLAATPPKGERRKNTEMRSRPRILRTPNGSQIPTNEDHGMELPQEELKGLDDGNREIDQVTHDEEGEEEVSPRGKGEEEEEEESPRGDGEEEEEEEESPRGGDEEDD